MGQKKAFLTVSAASVICGICLIVTSSLTLDLFRPGFEACRDTQSPIEGSDLTQCDIFDFWVAASSVGIVASIIQITSIGFMFLDKKGIWCSSHVIVCILAVISFGVAVAKDGLKDDMFSDKVKAFTVFCATDTVFAIVAIGVVYFLEGKVNE